MKKLDYKNVEKLTLAVIALGNIGDQAGHTNNWAMRAQVIIGGLMANSVKLMNLTNLDFSLIDDEVKDLDAEERKQLIETVKAEFDIVDDKLEEVIEKALEKVVTLGGFVKELMEFVTEVKDLFKK